MSRGWILITGTSRGIGRATVLRLLRSGFSVLAGVRDPADGAAIERDSDGRAVPLVLDIGRDDSIAAARDEVCERVGSTGLRGLVNNAGAGGCQTPMETVGRDALEGAFGVTAFGTMLTTAAFLPLVRRARGRIVNVGAGRLPLPLLGPGLGAKFAMEAMTDVLRVELRGVDVSISIVEPGMTAWEDVDEQLRVYGRDAERALERATEEDRPRYQRVVEHTKALHRRMMKTAAPADRVAATIERALTARRPRARYYCGWEQKSAALLDRFTNERIRDAIVGRMMGL